MLKLFAFGAGAGAGIQAWRNFPPDGPVTARTLAVVFIFSVLAAFLGGYWLQRGRGGARSSAQAAASATSSATATANPNQSVQFAVIMPGAGARPTGVMQPSEQAPWLAGAEVRPQITADDLDGIDPADLWPESTPEAAG